MLLKGFSVIMVRATKNGNPAHQLVAKDYIVYTKCFLLLGFTFYAGGALEVGLLPASLALQRESSQPWNSLIRKGAHASLESTPTGAFIDTSQPANISAQANGHAYLPCTVKRLGSRSVSWIRKSDGYLLTVDRDTFIADSRFQALHVASSDVWTLHIRNVRPDDATNYECQVSSEPKISHLFTLNVITPKVEIRGSPDVYVKSGSRVELQCILTEVLEEPPFIFWYHRGHRVILSDTGLSTAVETTNRRRRDTDTEDASVDDQDYHIDDVIYDDDDDDTEHTDGKKTPIKAGIKSTVIVRLQPGTIISVLSISSTSIQDEGTYECRPSSMPWANVTLHVLDGEHEEPAAAIQDSSHSSVASRAVSVIAAAVATWIFLW